MIFPAHQQKRLMQYRLAVEIGIFAGINHNAEIHFGITHAVEYQLLRLIAQ